MQPRLGLIGILIVHVVKLSMSQHLTFKQQLFVNQYVQNLGNATKAAMVAYNCRNQNIAGVIGCQNLRKLNIRSAIDHILTLAGVDETLIAEQLKPYVVGDSLNSIQLCCKLSGHIS